MGLRDRDSFKPAFQQQNEIHARGTNMPHIELITQQAAEILQMAEWYAECDWGYLVIRSDCNGMEE